MHFTSKSGARYWAAAAVAGLICALAPLDSVVGAPLWLAVPILLALSVQGRVHLDLARGLGIGLCWYGGSMSWVATSWSDVQESTAVPWLAWAGLSLMQALVPAMGLGLAGGLRSRGINLPVALGVGLAGAEAVAAWIQPLPGGLAVFMAPIQPVLWPAAWGGLTAWLLGLGLWAGWCVERPWLGLGGGLTWVAIGLAQPVHSAGALRVGIVQPNVGAFDGRRASTSEARTQKLIGLIGAAQAHGAELVLTPEGAWPATIDLRRDRTVTELLSQLPLASPVLLGVSVDEDVRRTNSLLLLTSDGLHSRTDKVHLVPLSERPIAGLGTQLFHPGTQAPPVKIGAAELAPRICYEDLIVAALRGLGPANLVVAASNDAWLGPQAGSRQHEAGSRLAAVLTGRWVVRPTNNGRSAVFDPAGRRRWHAPWVDGDADPNHPGIVSVQSVGLNRPLWAGADLDPWLQLGVGLMALVLLLRSARVDPGNPGLHAE